MNGDPNTPTGDTTRGPTRNSPHIARRVAQPAPAPPFSPPLANRQERNDSSDTLSFVNVAGTKRRGTGDRPSLRATLPYRIGDRSR